VFQSLKIGFDEFRSLRFAKEDASPLWRRGLDSVVLLNPETLEVEAEYPNFWSKGYTPMFLNICKKRKRIYGYSMSHTDSMFTILAIQNSETHAKTMNIPPEHKWAGMELSTDGNMMVIANACRVSDGSSSGKKEFVRVMAFDLENDQISPVCHKDFSSYNFSAVQFMRKIKGYDYFVMACRGSLAIIELKNAQSISMTSQAAFGSGRKPFESKEAPKKEFSVVKCFENLYENYIFEVAIFGNFMIPVSLNNGEESIKVISFGKESVPGTPGFIHQTNDSSVELNSAKALQSGANIFGYEPSVSQIVTPKISNF
jgi:hypothetical protein